MRLFRRVPTPFAITYLVSSLLRESVQKQKADKYAAQAVHYYNRVNLHIHPVPLVLWKKNLKD